MFTDKTLLITGGTGTFGNAVLRRFLKTDVREIRIFSRDEKKQRDMRLAYNSAKLKFHIGNVRSSDSLQDAMLGVDLVFHAAALKQVPPCEFHPMEALLTNALGSENVMNAALAAGVEHIVMLSTDKAAYPINAMGISKAMMEKLSVAKSRVAAHKGCVICNTRYGNVMGSRGSVIPLFVQQIKDGKPLTVTDPTVTRFMMSIDDAVELVVYAFKRGCPGDLFVQKASAVTIQTLAAALMTVFKVENDIRIIGRRHGEKQYETLLTREEMVRAVDQGRYYRVPADNRDLNYAGHSGAGWAVLHPAEDYTSHNAHRLSTDEMVAMLLELDLVQQELADWLGQETSSENLSYRRRGIHREQPSSPPHADRALERVGLRCAEHQDGVEGGTRESRFCLPLGGGEPS